MCFEIYHLRTDSICHGGICPAEDPSLSPRPVWDFRNITCTCCFFPLVFFSVSYFLLFSNKRVATGLRYAPVFIPQSSWDTILSVVSSGIFGITGVPSRPLSVCVVQKVAALCPTVARPRNRAAQGLILFQNRPLVLLWARYRNIATAFPVG